MQGYDHEGCTTSPSLEARKFSIDSLIQQQKQEISKNRKVVQSSSGANIVNIKKNKITTRKLNESAFSFSIV